MNLFSLINAPLSWPAGGLWESVIKWLAGIGNIGLAIIILTVGLKIVLLPLEFFQKRTARKMTTQQMVMQPELEAAQKKYGNNKELYQKKQMEIYRKHNINPLGSFFSMIVYLVLTIVVFFTLFSGLNNISRTKINYEYYQLEQEYRAVYNTNSADPNASEIAQEAVKVKYDEIREGFLLIKNVWRPDNWSSVFPKGEEFLTSTGTKFGYFEYEKGGVKVKYIVLSTNSAELVDEDEIKYMEPYVNLENKIYAIKDESDGAVNPANIEINGTNYEIIYPEVDETNTTYEAATGVAVKARFVSDFETVTAGINENYAGQWNGYLVLIVLAALITFLSSYLASVGIKARDAKGNIIKKPKPKPTMGIVMAIIMVFFTMSYTSAFALYIVTNSATSILFTLLINLLLNKIEENKEKKNTVVADYVRR